MLTFLNNKLKELGYFKGEDIEFLGAYSWEKPLPEPYSAYTRMIIYDKKRMQVFDYAGQEQHVIFSGTVEKEKEFMMLIKMLDL